MPSSPARIAIIGGGPAGLLLTRLLSVSQTPTNYTYTLFEAAPSFHRGPKQLGGTLDLHKNSGQAALDAAGLLPTFKELSRVEGEAMIVGDSTGKILYQTSPNQGRNKPEIDRQDLAKMLWESIPAENLRSGTKVKETVPAQEEGKWNVVLADGSTEGSFDLVVGADGAWSKIRSVLTDVKPYYSGATFVEFRVTDPKTSNPAMDEKVGHGSYFAVSVDDTCLLGAQRQSSGMVRIYAGLKVPETWAAESGLDLENDVPAVKEALLKSFYQSWAPEHRDWIAAADDDFSAWRPLYMLPVGLRWENKPGVTAIGDAAHLMTPFAGVGVNVGLQDAWELWKRIVAEGEGGLVQATKSYEEEMFVRAKKNAEMTGKGLENCFGLKIMNVFEKIDAFTSES